MSFDQITESVNLDRFIKKLVSTKIWKKKFFTISSIRIIKSLFNLTSTSKKILGSNKIDIMLYTFFVNLTDNDFRKSRYLIDLFQLQDESLIARVFGILSQKFDKKFNEFYLVNFKWINDLRLNSNYKILFEKENAYLNKSINYMFKFFTFKSFFGELGNLNFKEKIQIASYLPFLNLNLNGRSIFIITYSF